MPVHAVVRGRAVALPSRACRATDLAPQQDGRQRGAHPGALLLQPDGLVGRVEALGEPAVNGCEEVAGLACLASVAPEPSEIGLLAPDRTLRWARVYRVAPAKPQNRDEWASFRSMLDCATVWVAGRSQLGNLR